MTYAEMIPVNNSAELDKCFAGKKCNMTDDQREKVSAQISVHFGKAGFVVSPLGVVFSNSAEFNYMTLGRVDAEFNFYVKL